MKALLVLSLMTSCLIFSINSHAAVSVGGTRLVFHGDEKEASITVSNTNKGIPVLIQSWVDEGENSKAKAPFMITHHCFVLSPAGQYFARGFYGGKPCARP